MKSHQQYCILIVEALKDILNGQSSDRKDQVRNKCSKGKRDLAAQQYCDGYKHFRLLWLLCEK